MNAAELVQRLADLGFVVTWPDCWHCLAAGLAAGRGPGERPSAYDPDLVRAIHQADPGLGRAVLRRAGGWRVAPHDDAEFDITMRLWDTGHDPDEDTAPGDEDHWVAYELAGFGQGRRRVEVARCKDCGLPVWVTGLNHLGENDQWWRRIWPAHTTRTTTSTPPATSAAAAPVGTTRTTSTSVPHDSRRTR